MSGFNTCKAGKRPCLNDTLHFSDGNLEEILHSHKNPLIINVDIGLEHRISKLMVDPRSLVNVLYYKAFEKMDYKAENLTPFKDVVYDFTYTNLVIDTINLKVSLGAKETMVSRMAQFVVVKLGSVYNVLFR